MEGTGSGDEPARFRMKLGGAEIEFEGGVGPFEKFVMPTVAKIFSMVDTHQELQRPSAPRQIEGNASASVIQQKDQSNQSDGLDWSTDTIAVAMNAKAAADLAMAACAHLGLVKKKERVTRKEVLEQMKTAPSFYNANMHKNLSAILSSLTGPPSPRLRLIEKDVYALANDEKAKLEQLLAQIK